MPKVKMIVAPKAGHEYEGIDLSYYVTRGSQHGYKELILAGEPHIPQ